LIILIAGEIEIGKTTVCQNLIQFIEKSPFSCSGVLTLKKSNDLFVQDIHSDGAVLFAEKIRDTFDENTSRYEIQKEGITFRDQVVEQNQDSDILLIDEIGPRELNNPKNSILQRITERKDKLSILVVRKKYLERIQKRLKKKQSLE